MIYSSQKEHLLDVKICLFSIEFTTSKTRDSDECLAQGAGDTLWHLVTSGCLKYPHILSRAESKSPSNQNPACIILLTSYGREIKTDIKTKLKSPQPSSPWQGLAKHSCLTALISHLLCHNQLSKQRHVCFEYKAVCHIAVAEILIYRSMYLISVNILSLW